MLKIKCDINQQYLKTFENSLSTLNNFHSLEVVDRVSETQLQVGENLAVRGLRRTLHFHSIYKHKILTYAKVFI